MGKNTIQVQSVSVTDWTSGETLAGGQAQEQASALRLDLTSPAVGQVIGSNGKNYAADATLPTGVTKVAMIAYLNGSNGLAIALADEGNMSLIAGKTAAAAHTPVFTNGTWGVPSQDEWKQMFTANGDNVESYTGLNTKLATAGGDDSKLQQSQYWSSTYDTRAEGYAYRVELKSDGSVFYLNYNGVEYGEYHDNEKWIRAVLAF